jgi:hypothetical protein
MEGVPRLGLKITIS